MTKVKDLHRDWMKNPKYKTEYEALGMEFHLVRSLIEARTRAGLSQTQLARRMNTSQSYVARIESGQGKPEADQRQGGFSLLFPRCRAHRGQTRQHVSPSR